MPKNRSRKHSARNLQYNLSASLAKYKNIANVFLNSKGKSLTRLGSYARRNLSREQLRRLASKDGSSYEVILPNYELSNNMLSAVKTARAHVEIESAAEKALNNIAERIRWLKNPTKENIETARTIRNHKFGKIPNKNPGEFNLRGLNISKTGIPKWLPAYMRTRKAKGLNRDG